MDKFQAAFEILYFLSCVDGSVDDSELQVILRFLESNYGNVSFNPSEVIYSIAILNARGMQEELETAAMIFKNSSAARDRKLLLEFAVELIVADGEVSSEEKQLLQGLANLFGIDSDRLFMSITGSN